MLLYSHPRDAKHKGGEQMPDAPSKTAWEADNVIVARAKINRNQDPELYKLLKSSDNVGALTRDLLREALQQRKKC